MASDRGRAGRKACFGARYLGGGVRHEPKRHRRFLDPFIDTDTRLKLALDIARAHHARVIGVDVTSRGALEGEFHAQAGALEERFSDAIEAAGISGLYRVADQKIKDWKDFYAHYADLVIASQPSADMPKGLAAVTIEDVLLSAGTPMLILPANWQRTGDATLGRSACRP